MLRVDLVGLPDSSVAIFLLAFGYISSESPNANNLSLLPFANVCIILAIRYRGLQCT